MELVNKFGRVVLITDPEQCKKLLDSGKMRLATQAEIDARDASRKMVLSQQAEAAGTGIYYQTVSSSPDGYGMSRDIIKTELFRHGIYLSENYNKQKVGLLYNYPYGITSMHNDVRLIYTMFESDKLPDDWADYLDMADEVLVPSKWCADIFAKAGIKTTVVPLGYNDEIFDYIDRPVPVLNDGIFYFIHYDSFNARKGFIEVLEAFTKEFSPDEPVKLILKTVREDTALPILPSQYPNIEVVRGRMSERGLKDLIARAHCMVYPSRGEGFGITPLEAMATGIPAIVPNAHGISEYFNPNYMLEAKISHMEPALTRKYRGQNVGDMVVVDIDDLRAQMRFAYNNQQVMKQLGKDASEYVKKFTYKKTAEKLAAILERWQNTEVMKRPEAKILDVEVF